MSGWVTDDAFLGGRLQLLQPKTGYRAGVDAVLLASAAWPGDSSNGSKPGHLLRVGDFGAGVGTVGLCLAARLDGIAVDLIEREPELCDLARRNAGRNGLASRVRVVRCDVLARQDREALADNSYDFAVANPPFFETGKIRLPSDALRASAHAHGSGDLDGWVRCLARTVRPGGRIAMIHVVDALGALIAALSGRFGDIRLAPVYPRAGAAAIRILVTACKGSRAPMQIVPPVILHGPDGSFLPEIDRILKAPGALDVWS